MSKHLPLLALLVCTGCNVLAPPTPTPTAESRALAAVALAYHASRTVTPTPAPTPTPNPGKCQTCSGRGWLGDGQPRSDCPDCKSEKWDNYVYSQLPPTAAIAPPYPLPLDPVIVPARIPAAEPPLFAPDIEACWEANNHILVCFTSTDAELATLTKTLTILRNQPNPPDITFFHLTTTSDWGGQPAHEFWGVPKSTPSLHLFGPDRKLCASLSPARLLLSSPEKLGATLTRSLTPPEN